MTVSRRLMELIMKHCLRTGDKTFNLNDVYSAAASFATRLTINGVSIYADKYITPDDLLQVVLAAYAMTYSKRYAAGRTLQAFTQCEKELRAHESMGVWDVMKYWFSDGMMRAACVSVGGWWNDFVTRVATQKEAVSQLEIMIFQSVREVSIEELITAEDFSGEDTHKSDMDTLLDLSVRAVDVGPGDAGARSAVERILNVVRKTAPSQPSRAQPSVARNDPAVVGSGVRKEVKAVSAMYRQINHLDAMELTPEQRSVVASLKRGIYKCDMAAVVPMPGDGYCAYYAMMYSVGLDVRDLPSELRRTTVANFRRVLYSLAGDDEPTNRNLLLSVEDDGIPAWGTDQNFALLGRLAQYRMCVHMKDDAAAPVVVTRGYSDAYNLTKGPFIHIQWTGAVEGGGHVDVVDDDISPTQRTELRLNFVESAYEVYLRASGDVRERADEYGYLAAAMDLKDHRKTFLNRSGVKLAQMLGDPDLQAALSAPGVNVLDLCAAPGGFVRVVAAYNLSAKITAVSDTTTGVKFVPGLQAALVDADVAAAEGLPTGVDVVLADGGSPDAYRDDSLFITQVRVALSHLRRGGVLLVKTSNLHRDDYRHLIADFTGVRVLKPAASRLTNTEAYYIASGAHEGVLCADDTDTLRETLAGLRLAAVSGLDVYRECVGDAQRDARMPVAELDIELCRLSAAVQARKDRHFGGTLPSALRAARAVKPLTRAVSAMDLTFETAATSSGVLSVSGLSALSSVTVSTEDELAVPSLDVTTSTEYKTITPPKPTESMTSLYVGAGVGEAIAAAAAAPMRVPDADEGRAMAETAPVGGSTPPYDVLRDPRAKPDPSDVKRWEDAVACCPGVPPTPPIEFPLEIVPPPGKYRCERIIHNYGEAPGRPTGCYAGPLPDKIRTVVTGGGGLPTVRRKPIPPVRLNTFTKKVRVRDVAVDGSACTYGLAYDGTPMLKKFIVESVSVGVQCDPPGDDDVVSEGSVHIQLRRNLAPTARFFKDNTVKSPTVTLGERLPITAVRDLARVAAAPGLRRRTTALFMTSDAERLGIVFASPAGTGKVHMSEGFGALVNGDTARASMERSQYTAIPTIEVEGVGAVRVVPVKTKHLIICEVHTDADFDIAGKLLVAVAGCGRVVTVAVDAMELDVLRASAGSYMDIKRASKKIFVSLYEARGRDLSFMDGSMPATPVTQSAEGTEVSRAQRVQEDESARRAEERRAAVEERKADARKRDDAVRAVLKVADRAAAQVPISRAEMARKVAAANTDKTMMSALDAFRGRDTPGLAQEFVRYNAFPKLTQLDKGQVELPKLIPASDPKQHMYNAYEEFIALTRATLQINKTVCSEILDAFNRNDLPLLESKLKAEAGVIYDNIRHVVLFPPGAYATSHMVAYGAGGFVPRIERENDSSIRPGALEFANPHGDADVVVMTRATETMLDERVLARAKTLDADTFLGVPCDPWGEWRVPEIEWVNGVPGCGKTTWIVKHFDPADDMIVTTTREAARDVAERVRAEHGDVSASRVRTLASVLVNGARLDKGEELTRLLFDEALMNHFGAVVMACRLTGARRLVLIGDINQIPYIDRKNCFPLHYLTPGTVTPITKQLVCTHRNPLDVTYTLRHIYDGIYSAKRGTRSLSVQRFSGLQIPPDLEQTLYLTHNQGDKKSFASHGYGTAHESRLLTIHEAQGLTFKHVVIIRPTAKKLQIFDSVPHAVVAVTRHTDSCVYYSDDPGDAIARLVHAARAAGDREIVEYNLRMAIRAGDDPVVNRLRDAAMRSDAPEHMRGAVTSVTSKTQAFSGLPRVWTSRNRQPVAEPPKADLIPNLDAVALVTDEYERTRVPKAPTEGLRTVLLHDASGKPFVSKISEAIVRARAEECVSQVRANGGVLGLDALRFDGDPGLFGFESLRGFLESIPELTVVDTADGTVLRLNLSGGFMAIPDVFSVRLACVATSSANEILRGLYAAAHRTRSFMSRTGVAFAAPVESVGAARDADVRFLQTAYDEIFPGHAAQLYDRDQWCVDGSDLTLSVDRIQIEPGRSHLMDRKYTPLRPELNTMMPARRANSQREAILGLLKRNLNAPELTDPAMSRSYIGECLAKNFLKSAVDPAKAWMLEEYKRDPIELCPSLVDRWLDTQKPATARSAESDTGLEMRRYSHFSYMVKPDLKPPLEMAAAHEYASVQTIAYHSKDVNAIFCPIMLEVRDRLLRVFKDKIKIFTGMSPEEFVEKLNAEYDAEVLASCVTVENDVRKYDKSQDASVLQFECALMLAVGVPTYLVEYWFNAHTTSHF